MESSPQGPQYDRSQVALILKLAAERSTDDELMSLEEVQAIAREAGIAPETVQHVALTLQQTDRGMLAQILGAPTEFYYETTVDREVDPHEATALIDAAKWQLGHDGVARVGAETVEWSHKPDEGPLKLIQVTPRNGKTRIRIAGRYDDPAAWTLIGGTVATIAVSAAAVTLLDLSFPGAAGAVIGAGTATFAGMRALWRAVANRTSRRIRRLGEYLANQVSPADAGRDDPHL